ncbi:hypothetical protein TNCV_576771 [Trichonephila clavipes]|nr:hypothetical protein TNCV_576771 [Trichonephila clavipes]
MPLFRRLQLEITFGSCNSLNNDLIKGEWRPRQGPALRRREQLFGGRDSLVVKVSDRGWHVMSSSPVPLKNRRVGERCTLNLSTTQMSSRWCDS